MPVRKMNGGFGKSISMQAERESEYKVDFVFVCVCDVTMHGHFVYVCSVSTLL